MFKIYESFNDESDIKEIMWGAKNNEFYLSICCKDDVTAMVFSLAMNDMLRDALSENGKIKYYLAAKSQFNPVTLCGDLKEITQALVKYMSYYLDDKIKNSLSALPKNPEFKKLEEGMNIEVKVTCSPSGKMVFQGQTSLLFTSHTNATTSKSTARTGCCLVS